MPTISIRAYYETSWKADEIQREKKRQYHNDDRVIKDGKSEEITKISYYLPTQLIVYGKEKCFWGGDHKGTWQVWIQRQFVRLLKSPIVKRPISNVKPNLLSGIWLFPSC